MPKRIEHEVKNGVELKRCGWCKKYKELGEFHKANNTWDGLFYKCIKCTNEARNSNTRRRATAKHNAMCWRCQNEERYINKGIKVKVSLEDFVEWYQSNHIEKGCHVDRIDNHGHYEIGNLQVLTQREHNLKRHQDRLDWIGITETEGMRYCFFCKTLKPETEFYSKRKKLSISNKKGLSERCKKCYPIKRRII